METLFIEASSIECSEERREISGKIVPLGTGEVGNTNLGAYSFEAGSIEIGDVSKIKLLSQHDMKKPIGRMTAAETRADGIYATFKLSRSQAGSDSLIMASEGLVTGLSIGAEILASKPSRDGHTVVSSARLKEVSLLGQFHCHCLHLRSRTLGILLPLFSLFRILLAHHIYLFPRRNTEPSTESCHRHHTTKHHTFQSLLSLARTFS